jgi:glutamate-ammonia-ligase adenylyltransferase
MVQYAVLAHASEHPALTEWTDNIRILQSLVQCGLMDQRDAGLLTDAYRTYRDRVHRLTLLDEPALADASEYPEERAGVLGLWRRMMETD